VVFSATKRRSNPIWSLATIQSLIPYATIDMEFTRRGRLPETRCLLRVQQGFTIGPRSA
jgi:hypothetical protein